LNTLRNDILFVGAGNMGMAILKGYKANGGNTSLVSIVDPNLNEALASEIDIKKVYRSFSEIAQEQTFSCIVIAVKPQMFEEVSSSLGRLLTSDSLVVSIMAGIGTNRILQNIGHTGPIIRCMPNMAASVGLSANVAFASNPDFKEQFEKLFKGAGPISWVENEELIHTTTAISGSGPAYFFAFTEALALAGMKNGLEYDFALKLSIDTAIGAAELMKVSRSPSSLRESVMSKGGTTVAALDVFSKDEQLSLLVEDAVSAAKNRSKEM